MFSVFCKKPFFVNKPLREILLQTTNDSIKRQIEFKEKQKFHNLITTSLASLNNNGSNDPNRPNDDALIPYIIGFLSLSSIFYYFYFKKR